MKNKNSISFLLPAAISTPGGGYKMILEHANHLAEKGYCVFVECPATLNWRKQNLLGKLKQLRIYLKRKYKIGYSCESWFNLHPNVKVRWILSLNYKFVQKADLYIATEARTAPYLNEYPIENFRKFYFIQDYENWCLPEKQLRKTYHFKMTKMVITHWLQDIIEKEENEKCYLTPNGFYTEEYHITIPIKEKEKYTISLLNHWQERKDLPMAFAALDIVKRKIPQLQVLIFGEQKEPILPNWYHYFYKPSPEQHLKINNRAAIYVGSSKVEGFGLTIGEAMLCGQAVACTDNLGYQEMAKHNETALLSPKGDAIALAKNIIRLINNDDLRYKLAQAGHDYIKRHFVWEISHQKFDSVLKNRQQ